MTALLCAAASSPHLTHMDSSSNVITTQTPNIVNISDDSIGLHQWIVGTSTVAYIGTQSGLGLRAARRGLLVVRGGAWCARWSGLN